jgi:colicin import membrane protein
VQVTPPPVERAQPRPPEKELPVPKDPPRVNTPTIDPTPIKPAPRKPHEINVDTTLVTSSAADAKAKRDAQQKAAAAAAAKERQHLANIAAAFGQATKGIRNGVAGGVKVNVSPGPGGGGVSYGNIQSAIFTRYYEAWKVPDGSPDLKVYVSITLARDGAVVTSRITKRSGNADLDESVQKALDRVRFVAPLPEGETADTREFEFNFKPEMKSAE